MSIRHPKVSPNNSPNYFLLMSGPAEDLSCKRLEAYQVATIRLEGGLWPIFERTPNRRVLKGGDHCLVYLTGRGREGQSILCQFSIGRIVPPSPRVDRELASSVPIAFALEILNLVKFDPPKPVRPKLSNLSFMGTNEKRWGMAFRCGCRRLLESDYRLLIR